MAVEHSKVSNENEQKLTETMRFIVEGIRKNDVERLHEIEPGFDNMVELGDEMMKSSLLPTFQSHTYSMDF